MKPIQIVDEAFVVWTKVAVTRLYCIYINFPLPRDFTDAPADILCRKYLPNWSPAANQRRPRVCVCVRACVCECSSALTTPGGAVSQSRMTSQRANDFGSSLFFRELWRWKTSRHGNTHVYWLNNNRVTANKISLNDCIPKYSVCLCVSLGLCVCVISPFFLRPVNELMMNVHSFNY